jgi:hypothetical protein
MSIYRCNIHFKYLKDIMGKVYLKHQFNLIFDRHSYFRILRLKMGHLNLKNLRFYIFKN